ncbi:MAG: hypothetical protein RL701_7708 [Pseudomonadota bacterium]|jgi:hypothetical protein
MLVTGADPLRCSKLRSALLHRYTFEGTGRTARDSYGTADGTAIGAELFGTGTLRFDPTEAAQYVELPAGIIAGLQDTTFEVWLSVASTRQWARVFDFGHPNTDRATRRSYLFLTVQGSTQGRPRAVYLSSDRNASEVVVNASRSLQPGALTHFAVVFDSAQHKLRLFINGQPDGEATVAGSLAAVDATNNWLGRSQFSSDPYLDGTLHEFRIYSTALTADQISASFNAGSDPQYLANQSTM